MAESPRLEGFAADSPRLEGFAGDSDPGDDEGLAAAEAPKQNSPKQKGYTTWSGAEDAREREQDGEPLDV